MSVPDLFRKTMLAGMGLALQAWDEVENLAREMIKKSEMSEKEGTKFLKDLKHRYSETQTKLEARVEEAVKKFLKKADVVTADELKALKKEVRQLKKMINSETEKSD
jgi:polyhydroxyalkanoate synthesis regulator phasin